MGYQVLARKYRPQRFADVAGQDHVTCTLMNALRQNRVAHGYIFSGHRGIGKTTIARILAQALNCRKEVGSAERPDAEPCGVCDSCIEIRQGNAVDVIEIDAATNRGIDEVRKLRDDARYDPARDRYKIYILDEAHQITEAAFNALLKTLEEPPAHVIFMMATTEPENIPQTIRSRCQHFSFHAVKFDDILNQLRNIAGAEQVAAEDDALALLAEAGDGSMRDALSIMDQAIASAPAENGRPVLAAAQIRDLMGSVPNAVFERLLEAVSQGQSAALMEQLNTLLNAGHSPSSLARQMVRYLRNTLMAKLAGEQTELLQISADERARVVRTAMLFSEEEITRNLQIVLRTFDELNYRQEQRFHLELGLLKLIHAQRLLPIEELLSGVSAGGGPRATSAPPAPRPAAAATAPARAASAAPSMSPFGPSSNPGSSSGSGPGSTRGAGPSMKQSAAQTPAMAVMAAPEAVAAPASAASVPSSAMPALDVPAFAVPAPVRNAAAAGPAPVTSVPVSSTPSAAFAVSQSLPAVSGSLQGFAEAAAMNEAPMTEGSLAKALEPAPAAGNVDAGALQAGVVAALSNAGHTSASELMRTAAFLVEGSTVRIEVPGMGKKMVALTVNAAAEKIVRQELQRLGAPTRFMVVPGAGSGAPAVAASAAPLAGSIEEAALANPLVGRAREIFQAEVRSVVDLRQK
jgi:DNA polymerase-3 subunit gamma/tau